MRDPSNVTSREPSGSAPSLARPTDQARRMLRLAALLLGGLAVVVAAAVGVTAALTATDHDAPLTGLIVAVSVLLVCWTLLGVALACGHRHLAATDRRQWTADWSRVEPEWTVRRQRASGPDTTDPSTTG
jgi:hypothetical protein